MKVFSKIAASVVFLGAFILLCMNYSNKESVSSNVKIEKMDKGQFISIALDKDPISLDSSKAKGEEAAQVLLEVMEGLTRMERDQDGNSHIQPAGAESWQVSEDELTWTFKLRDNRWSDGKRVTAEDYVYGIQRCLNPKNNYQDAFVLYPIKGASSFNKDKAGEKIVGVKAIDSNTLQIQLESPCAYFLNLTCSQGMLPQRKDMAEKYKEQYGTSANTILYCGPFIVRQWSQGKLIELKKNEQYWDAKSVHLERISIKIATEEQRMNALLHGEIDTAFVENPKWAEKMASEKELIAIQKESPIVYCKFFNQKDKLFCNDKIRKAFSLAIAREDMVKNLYKGNALPAYGWCPPGIEVNGKSFRKEMKEQPVEKLIEMNREPKKLLEEGLKELDIQRSSSEIMVSFLQLGTDQVAREFAAYFQNMWSKTLGVTVKVEYADENTFQKKIANMEYQVADMAWQGDFNDPLAFLEVGFSQNICIPTGYKNEEYNEYIRQAYKSTEYKTRIENLKKAEMKLIYEDAVIAPTAYRVQNIYQYKYVKGIILHPFIPGVELKYAYTENRKVQE